MAGIKSRKGFDLCRWIEAMVAVSLLFAWGGFWQNTFVWFLQIFQRLCYSLVDGRNRTLKTRYAKGSKTLQFKH